MSIIQHTQAYALRPPVERSVVAAGRPDKIVWGMPQGVIDLPSFASNQSRKLAESYFQECNAQDFCGDPVETRFVPRWMPSIGEWFPAAEVAALGFERLPAPTEQQVQLVISCSTDAHTDFHGPTLFFVLHNHLLKFKQGVRSFEHKAGEWFLFDDKRVHEVFSKSEKSTAYMGIAVALRAIGRH